ncbi:hypothetical protein LPAF129_18380 [Ligilactobacillus pabuli]|uniref:Uncharacterized protein n=1 Tax=Ligilactobacillus pabuli TaxID=2886039 RepID=A0ABQ5JJA7_9LACO|nr:hypothetical protein [Ligilactobacillus pabuli]GKS82152.1 hypothetical protein LPAF129_18380 [Ligilactobacillus pabuli]HIW89452.1 hypothetical protein [Candidatus Ligilactobacillus excrementipullorum]
MTDIIYIIADDYSDNRVDTFEFLQENNGMLGKRNENRTLYLFKVNSQGIVSPENSKVQQIVNVLGTTDLPLALAIKKGELLTANELSSLFEGLDIQEDDDEGEPED